MKMHEALSKKQKEDSAEQDDSLDAANAADGELRVEDHDYLYNARQQNLNSASTPNIASLSQTDMFRTGTSLLKSPGARRAFKLPLDEDCLINPPKAPPKRNLYSFLDRPKPTIKR